MRTVGRLFAPFALALFAPLAHADGWLGVTVEELESGGVAVVEVAADGPAAKVGIAKGDVIEKFNGQKIGDIDALAAQLGNTVAGDFATLSIRRPVRRGAKTLVLRVKLGDRDAKVEEIIEEVAIAEAVEAVPLIVPARPAKPAIPQEPEVVRRSAKGGTYLGVRLEAGEGGDVQINSVVENSPAARIGMQAGERILDVDGKKVDNVEKLVALVKSKKPGDQMRVRTVRGEGEKRSEFTYVFKLGRAPMMGADTPPAALGGTVIRKPKKSTKPAGGMVLVRPAEPRKVAGKQVPPVKTKPAAKKPAKKNAKNPAVRRQPAAQTEIDQLRKEIQGLRREMRQLRQLLQKMAAEKGGR